MSKKYIDIAINRNQNESSLSVRLLNGSNRRARLITSRQDDSFEIKKRSALTDNPFDLGRVLPTEMVVPCFAGSIDSLLENLCRTKIIRFIEICLLV